MSDRQTPSTPTGRHRRRPSNLDASSASPSYASNGFSPVGSRRTSSTSIENSPVTPRQHTRHKTQGSISVSSDGGFPSLAEETGGMGNLADELADAWDDEEMDPSSSYMGNGEESVTQNGEVEENTMDFPEVHDLGFGDALKRPESLSPNLLQPPNVLKLAKGRSHSRTPSTYDGSDYGDQSDLESDDGISPTLAARIADIEALGRLGKGDAGLASDDIISRTILSLRDLGAQASIENGTTRLMTAHASLTSHLTHQTRTIQTLTHSLLKTPFPDLDLDSLEELTDATSDLLPLLPFPPQPSPVQSLQLLINSTGEITHLLRSISDTLHESRLVTNTATRRLKTVKDMVGESRKEEDEREFGIAWIEKGNWDQRLASREAEKICGEVCSGFERTCEGWRERLVSGAVAA